MEGEASEGTRRMRIDGEFQKKESFPTCGLKHKHRAMIFHVQNKFCYCYRESSWRDRQNARADPVTFDRNVKRFRTASPGDAFLGTVGGVTGVAWFAR